MKGSLVRIALIITIVGTIAAAFLLARSENDEARAAAAKPREIRIVVKHMTFYVDGVQAPNPSLRVKAGERIRLVLRNEDAGMTHDFAVKAWQVATKTLTEKGQEDAVEFRVPKQRGEIPYQCTPHSEMMKGSIRVE